MFILYFYTSIYSKKPKMLKCFKHFNLNKKKNNEKQLEN